MATAVSTDIGSYLKLWTQDGAGDQKNLLITAHGGSMSRPGGFANETARKVPGLGGWFHVPSWTTLYFYGPHKKALEDPGFHDVVSGHLEVVDNYGPDGTVRNYRLTHYEKDLESSIKRQIESDSVAFDILQLRNRGLGSDEGATLKGVVGYTLHDVLGDLSNAGHTYPHIHCSFCRCTSLQIAISAVTANCVRVPSHKAKDNRM